MRKNKHGGYIGPAFIANTGLTFVLVAIVVLVVRFSLWLWNATGVFEAVLLLIGFGLFFVAVTIQITMEKRAKKAAARELDRIIQDLADGKAISDEDSAKIRSNVKQIYKGPIIRPLSNSKEDA